MAPKPFLCFQRVCSSSGHKLACFTKSLFFLSACVSRVFLKRANALLVQILYFLSLSVLGFGILKILKLRASTSSVTNIDLFFTSVSATTVSSMATLEMEIFSNPQLIVMTILMFVGGEVFTSMLGLHFIRSKLKSELDKIASSHAKLSSHNLSISIDQFELGVIPKSNLDGSKPQEPHHHEDDVDDHDDDVISRVYDETLTHESLGATSKNLRYSSMKYLGFLVLGYLIFVHVAGVIAVSIYLAVISSAKKIVENKGLNKFTFSVFTVVSTFASCGFVPTNENMVVFKKNSGLLLLLIPQVLLGNTLYPPCLRFSVWVIGKLGYKKKETEYLLEKTEEVGYKHLLQGRYSVFLVATVVGFIVVQVIVFCSLDWNSEGLVGMSGYEKLVGVFFQSVNSRHTGETIVDISILSPAILVVFVVMMYLPPYTSFNPVKDDDEKDSASGERKRKRKGKVVENLVFSQLSYLVIFVILVCITERRKMKEDPLNFNVLNIVIEVISAYGNVGFTTGYSCERQLHEDPKCQDKWIGFVGKWSNGGKLILILVMLFGRLKKFNMHGGKAWTLI